MTTTIAPQPTAALAVTRAAREEYRLTDQDGRLRASLRVGWLLRRGEISIDDDTTSVRRHVGGKVTAGEGDRPLVRLSRTRSLIPGYESEASWVISRNLRAYQGTLTQGEHTMVTCLPTRSGHRFAIHLTGDWERRELVVLTACFALLARRRRDITIMMAVSSSHAS